MQTLFAVQSHFSFHWGTAAPADWFNKARELGYAYLGIADHASLAGLPEILKLAEQSPVKALYGACFPLLDSRSAYAYVETAAGYGNLCQRIGEWLRLWGKGAKNHGGGGVPALEEEQARRFFQAAAALDGLTGLVWITDSLPLWRTLAAAGGESYWRIGPTLAVPPKEIPAAATLCAPGPLFLRPDDFTTHRLLRAVGTGLPFAAIPEDPRISPNNAAVTLVAAPDRVLQAPEAYADAFAVYADAVSRADAVARRLAAFSPRRDFLHPPAPENHGEYAAEGKGSAETPPDEAPLARLRRLAYEGALIRYGGVDRAVRRRLEHELDLIGRKGFSEYFLVVHDIVNRIAGGDGRIKRGRSITCGRGSGAASLVNYCLGVTNVDVIRHDLMFERFLNDARRDPPDIDVDFAWDERDGVLERVIAGYGDTRVGRVANHNRYDWRGAFRAAARALGFSDPEISRRIGERVELYGETHPGNTPLPEVETVRSGKATGGAAAGGKAKNEVVPAQAANTDLAPVSRAYRKLALLNRDGGGDWQVAQRLARRLVDKPHGLSMHCGGMVITPGPIARHVPTIVSAKGQPTIQWEKDGAEDMGLVKIDLLGNRSLAVIRDAVGAVALARGIPDTEVIPGDPADDPATRELIARGDTFGVFYLESPAMRLLLAKARRGDFAHTVIHSSIIRPAANAFINEYLERLHGKHWSPEHPLLAGLFDESYGIPVYQEDVVKLAMALAGYDYARADGIRKCLGKRDARERLSAAFPELAAAARQRGVDDATLAGFWRTLMSMTGYSFCKPHSASYARVSYEAAYLRAHYPAWFMAAVLANGGGFYTAQAYVSEAMRLGLAVLGPDANASAAAWAAEGAGAIRAGLDAISGRAAAAARDIVAERERNGRYRNLDAFLRRTALAADDYRRLALVGALDALALDWNRPQILWHCGRDRERERRLGGGCGGVAGEGRVIAGASRGESLSGGGSLFSPVLTGARDGLELVPPPPPLPPYSLAESWAAEYAALDFLPGRHPLAMFAEEVRAGRARRAARARPIFTDARNLPRFAGKVVVFLAWPITGKVVETKHGEAMAFQSFEDEGALCEAVLFPDEFRRYQRLITARRPLWVTGRVMLEFGVATLQVLDIQAARADEERRPSIPPPPVQAQAVASGRGPH